MNETNVDIAGGVSLVLTAAVSPNAAGKTALTDPQERISQYRAAIASLLQKGVHEKSRLSVVETTGFPLDELRRTFGIRNDEVELFSYSPSVGELTRGKGAAEMGALRHVVESTSGHSPDETIYKLTGRLILEDAEQQLIPLRRNELIVRGTIDGTWFDTRFFGASRKVWEGWLVDVAENVDDSRSFFLERALASAVASDVAAGLLVRRQFSNRPILVGASGSTGRTYSSFVERAKSRLLGQAEKALARIAHTKQV